VVRNTEILEQSRSHYDKDAVALDFIWELENNNQGDKLCKFYNLFKELPKYTNMHVHSSVLMSPAEFIQRLIEDEPER